MSGVTIVKSDGLFYNGIDYTKLSVRELQQESIKWSNAYQSSLLEAVDKKKPIDDFLRDAEQIGAVNQVITTAYERALDRVLG